MYWKFYAYHVECTGCSNGVQLVNSLQLCDKDNGSCICQNEFVRGELCDSCIVNQINSFVKTFKSL